MSNRVPCPNCGTEIDATQAAIESMCPECEASFYELVQIAADTDNDPENAGPFHQVNP